MPVKSVAMLFGSMVMYACGGDAGPTPEVAVASVIITRPAATLAIDSRMQLAVTARSAAGDALTGRQVTWQSSSIAIAAVSSTGEVTGVTSGDVTITATVQGIAGTTTLTVTPPTAPASRWESSMVYDSFRQQLLLIAGSTVEGSGATAVTTFRGDVWAWNGTAWTLVALQGPTPRDGPIVGFDGVAQRVIVHGGRDPRVVGGSNPPLTDTWIANSSQWTQAATSGPTPARHHAGGGWDVGRARLVMFGGGDPSVIHRDTWEWDGTTWSLRATTTPTLLSAPSNGAYSSARNALLLLVGTFSSGPTEIWQWSGSAWSKVGDGPTGAMPMRIAATGANELLIFDGGTGNTYRWNGTTTTQVSSTGPGLRATPAMGYDPSRQRAVLFGGYRGTSTLADTWVWNGTAWTLVAQ